MDCRGCEPRAKRVVKTDAAWYRLSDYTLRLRPVCEAWTVMKARGFKLRREDEDAEPCGEAAAEVDHIVPTLRRTGREKQSELQTLCKAHHSRKTQVYDRGVERR